MIKKPLKIIFFVGKNGGDYFALKKAKQLGLIDFNIMFLFTNHMESKAYLDYKETNKYFYMKEKDLNKEIFFKKCFTILQNIDFDYIFLSGFSLILPKFFVEKFEGRIINSHHSLLPAHPGLYRKEKIVELDDKFLGATLHLVDQGVDTGKKLFQAVFLNYGIDNFEKILDLFRFIQDVMIVQLTKDLSEDYNNDRIVSFRDILFNPGIEQDILTCYGGHIFGENIHK